MPFASASAAALRRRSFAAAAAISALAGVALAQPQQQVTGPVATYWMTAETSTGFGAGNAGGISAMMGGGASKTLLLQLGSSRRPSGEPAAEHLPPPALRAGASLPLVTPRAARPEPGATPGMPESLEHPRGRMLIFWGCGERAPQGQPVVIDFAQLRTNPQAMANMQGFSFTPMQPPSPTRSATYGEWPNERGRTSVPANGSLVGQHVVRGNYSPEISFNLAQNQDFLAPVNLTRNSVGAAGEVQLAWNAVPGALAFFATAMGASEDGETMVVWSSSQTRNAGFGAPDFMAAADIQRFVQSRALMGPQTTTCSVYKEAKDAMAQGMVQLTAYGDETNISYPPRPENRAQPWNIEWSVKVRRKSATSGLLGMDMAAMMGSQGEEEAPPAQQPKQAPRTPRPSVGDVLRGLGGLRGF